MPSLRVIQSLPSPYLPNPLPGTLYPLRWLGRKLQYDLYQVAAATGRRGKDVWTGAGPAACRDLAQALAKILPGGVFVYLCEDGRCDLQVNHVAVFWRGVMLDADGASLPAEWVDTWRRYEGLSNPCVVMVDAGVGEMTDRGESLYKMLGCSLKPYIQMMLG